MTDDEVTVWCDIAGAEVPACACGPHEDCPEHLLNCVFGLDDDERVGAEVAAYFERQESAGA